MDSLDILREKMRSFAQERDWDKFHSPKNLSMALAGEAGELLELFQWLTEEESTILDADKKKRIAEELADIQLYLVRLSDKLSIDLFVACEEKIKSNAIKYPIEKSKGIAKKYTEL
jgi:dCTP diphosphatase